MNKKKLFLIAVISLGNFLALGPMAHADDQDKDTTPPPPAKHRPPPRGVNAQARLTQMKEELNLSDDQVEKVKGVLQDERAKIKALQDDTNLTKEDRRTKAKEIRESIQGKMKGILTTEQYQKWEKTHEGRRKRPVEQ